MMSRHIQKIVILLATISCLSYFAMGASVRRSSERTLRQAAVLTLKGEHAQARDTLKWLLWFEPRHPQAHHLAAMSFLKQNNLPAAMKHLQSISADSAIHESAQSLLANALLADQQLDQAEEVLSRHLLRYPKSVIARRQLFGIFLTELRTREAIRVQEEYLQVSASDPLSLSDRLLMLRDLATSEFHPPLPQACLTTLQKALQQHPNQPLVEFALGRCYLQLGNTDDAEPLLEKAVSRGTFNPEAQLLYGELWIVKGDSDRAEAALFVESDKPNSLTENGSKAFEQDDRFWELRCRIAESRSDYDRALSDLDHAASIRPASKEIESRRARILQQMRRTEDARDAYSRSHVLARAELDLWKLSRDLGVEMPTVADCERVATLYELLGKKPQADSWRQLGRQVSLENPLESDLDRR